MLFCDKKVVKFKNYGANVYQISDKFVGFICWVTGGKGEKGEDERIKGVKCMVMEREWTSGGKHTM